MSTLGEEQTKRATSARHATWAGTYYHGYNSEVGEHPSVHANLVKETLNDR